ncbi:MAG: hypothetical protein QM755_03125 [Luteolibacter sp.]
MKTLFGSVALLFLPLSARASHSAPILWTSITAECPQATVNLRFAPSSPGYRLTSLEMRAPDGAIGRLDDATFAKIGNLADLQLYEFGPRGDTGLVLMLDFFDKPAKGDHSVMLCYYWHGKIQGSELYRLDDSDEDEKWSKAEVSKGMGLYPVTTGDPRKFFLNPAPCIRTVLHAETEQVTIEARAEGDELTSLSGTSGEHKFTIPSPLLKGIHKPDMLSFQAMIQRESPADHRVQVAPEFGLEFCYGTHTTFPASTGESATEAHARPLTVSPRCEFHGIFVPDAIERTRIEPLAIRGQWLSYYLGLEGGESLKGAQGYTD